MGVVRSSCACALAALVISAALPACDSEVYLGAIADGGNNVLWSATFERGDLSEWSGDGLGGTVLENAKLPIVATTDVAHTGQYAGKVAPAPTMHLASLSYLSRQQPSPHEGYYGAWFYVPTTVTVGSYVSISHFRGSHTGDGRNVYGIWDVNFYPLPSGGLAAQLYNFVTQVNLQQPSPVPIATGRWVHLEVLFRKASDATGTVAVWQDDVQLLNVSGVATTENEWLEWDVGGASDDLSPSPAAVYIDDAAISLTRLGNHG